MAGAETPLFTPLEVGTLTSFRKSRTVPRLKANRPGGHWMSLPAAVYYTRWGLGYRGQALKLFPWICGRCAREFDHTNVHELTVHHKNHDHDHNPADGSNWELLCLYCHDNEHQRQLEQHGGLSAEGTSTARGATHTPFADLASLIKKKS